MSIACFYLRRNTHVRHPDAVTVSVSDTGPVSVPTGTLYKPTV